MVASNNDWALSTPSTLCHRRPGAPERQWAHWTHAFRGFIAI